MHGPPPGWATEREQHAPTYAAHEVSWLLAQPTAGQARAGDPLADPAFHHAMAERVPVGTGLLLGERLAWSRGPGGRTVAGAWAAGGAEVTVVADADPRRQSGTRQLLVDGARSVEQWAHSVRQLGATGGCWHAELQTPTGDQARVTAEIVEAMRLADLDPMLWFGGPGAPAAMRDLVGATAAHGADLGRLSVCVALDPPAAGWDGRLAEVVTGLLDAVPATVRRVVVVVARDRLHLAQDDAYELAQALVQHPAPWPVVHCAGDLALRQVGGWWREPGLSRRAANRFETILAQLTRPSGPVYVRRPEGMADAPDEVGPSVARARGTFDTSLFKRRSLYRSSRRPTP